MKRNGSMTVFFCLITVLVSALIGTCLESARTAGLRFMAKTASGSALQSVFAEYHEELWERYQVFFHYGPDGLQDEVEEYITYYTDPGKDLSGLPDYTDFWGLQLEAVEITETKTMLSEGGRQFLEQAIEYEKYQVAASILEMFLEQAGILDEVDKVRSFVKRISDCLEIIQQINVLYQDVRDIVVDVQVGAGVMKELLEEEAMSLADLRTKAQQLRELFERLSLSVSNYRETAEKIKELAVELRQEYGGETDTIYDEQISQLEIFTEIGNIGKAVFRLGDGLSSICGQISALESEVDEWLGAENPAADAAAKAAEVSSRLKEMVESSLTLMQEVENVFAENETGDEQEGAADSSEDEGETEIEPQEGQSLLDLVKEWKNMAVLSLVLGGDAEATRQDRITDSSLLPSEMMSEELTDVTIEEKALFAFYIGDTFSCWTSEVQGDFAYQQEYILFGKEDSRGNLAAMAETLLAVREGLNLAYLLTNAQMRTLTESAAIALVGATGIYPLVVITQFILMAAWAFAESVWDVKSLFRGESVPIWKTESTWRTSLGGLVATAENQPAAADLLESSPSLSYNGYLRIFLFLNSTEKLCAASLDMVQEDIRRTEPGFLVADCYGEASVRAEFSSAYRLITLPLIGVGPGGGHQITAECGYQY